MTTNECIEYYKVIAICRRLADADLLRLAEALFEGGVRLMEVTFDQANAACCDETARSIRMLRAKFGDDMRIGAGTVLTVAQLEAARRAGACYIISPNTNPDLIRRTKELGLTSIPGASTPSEIVTANDSGADFVKLFPAGYYGLSYLHDIRAPLSHIKLIATAGINEQNLGQYLDQGVTGAGISGYLTSKDLIAKKNFQELTKRAATLMEIVASRRGHTD